MLSGNELKEGDTFYYILPRHFSEKGFEHLEFRVFVYQFCKDLHHCFDEKKMFLTKKEAEKVCDEMNKNNGY